LKAIFRLEVQKEIAVSDAQQLADRYVTVWNETDAEARRQAIAALWPPDGVHHVRDREAGG
jgi:hypothetical protein